MVYLNMLTVDQHYLSAVVFILSDVYGLYINGVEMKRSWKYNVD